eukprot:11177571-Lingulodinium_polyedra.AAC.1
MASSAEAVLKRPAKRSRQAVLADSPAPTTAAEEAQPSQEVEEVKPDTSGVTMQQRHVWKRYYTKLPAEVQTAYEDVRK